MNEFTRSLLYIALLVCVPIVTACIQKGIAFCVRKQAHFTAVTCSPLRHKLLQQCQTLLG